MVKGSSLAFGADYSFFSDAALVAGPPSHPQYPLFALHSCHQPRPQGFEFLARILIGLCRLLSPPDQINIYN